MIIRSNGWVFRVFPTENRKHYARELAEHCECAWCRNFYGAVDRNYPELRPFLEQLGVHIEAPEEMMAFSPTSCICAYAICGEILEQGEEEITVGGLTLTPLTLEEAKLDTDMDDPVFFLRTDCMTLPWILDEPMDKADSPAKGRNFISRLLAPWITE